MRLFYSYILFFLIAFPFVRLYVAKYDRLTDLLTVPRLISILFLGYMFATVALYVWVPTYREHIEPSITIISLMIAEGYPAYTSFSDPNVYSILYGPSTYLFQSKFLQLFSNPILGSKIYGALCFSIGAGVLMSSLGRKYGFRCTLQGMLYFSAIVLLFAQVSFRNQSDSTIFLGNSLAVSSLLLPSTWLGKILLAFGGALSISAKFHSAGYILPLLYLFYLQHGLKSLLATGVLCLGLIFSPFLLESYDLSNFLNTMQAYSKLKLHVWLFAHNLSMAYVIFLPLLLLMIFALKNQDIRPILAKEVVWTFLLTNTMIILVCLTAAIDGAGSYHVAHFAPVVAVLFTIYYSCYREPFRMSYRTGTQGYKKLCLTSLVAWSLAILVFIVSVQKKYIWFLQDNSSRAIETEVLSIKQEIEKNNWHVLFGYSDEKGYPYTYYRPLLWSAIKDNSMDPIALMGRHAIRVGIPSTGLKKISEQYYDVVIIPKPGKPFSMYNWHPPHQKIFGERLSEIFSQNYLPIKEYSHFILWHAKKRHQDH